MLSRHAKRKKRHFRIRKRAIGTADKPRLSVHRSLGNIYVQLVDDFNERTVLGLSTLSKEVKQKCHYGGNKKAAEALGIAIATRMKEKGIGGVCFDRSGYQYHGRLKTLAETLRKNGIQF